MLRITDDISREQVIEAFENDLDIVLESNDGSDVTGLYCPHCDTWLGDPTDPQIAHVSITHPIGECHVAEENDFENVDAIDWGGFS